MTEKSSTTPKRALVIHPVLFAVHPVLFLFAQNISQFRLRVTLEPLVVLLGGAVVLWVVLGLILRNVRKAGIVVSLFYLLFFSYRLIRNVVPHFTWVVWEGFNVGPGKTTIAGMGVVFVVVGVLTVLTKHNLRKLTPVINVVAMTLVVISVCRIAVFEFRSRDRSLNIKEMKSAWDNVPVPEDTSRLPDIYYIICDAYTRHDILREYYGYDNTYFLDWLEEHGFYVARRSRTNYNFTGMSLPTSVNMMMLPELVKAIGARGAEPTSMTEAMNHSRVTRFLRRRGYQSIAFSTGYVITDITNADVFLKPGARLTHEFHNGLLDMTPLVRVTKKLAFNQRHRNLILFVLETLKSLPKRRSPKFVYAHVMAPHRPFVFGPNGEHVNPPHLYPPGGPEWPGEKEQADYQKYYGNELTFLNRKLMEVVTAIKQKSKVPPIIIIQGDHGACSMVRDVDNPTPEGLKERMSILNVYHLPGGGEKALYPTITPVNSFRVILNHYFGTELPLIKDRSFYRSGGKEIEFVDIAERVGDADRDRGE